MTLYRKLLAIHLKSAMAYRTSFFFSCLGQLLITVNSALGVWFLLQRFDTIGNYTLPQLALGFAVIIFGYSIAQCFARGFDRFSFLISDGTFDRMLVRPRGLIFQVLCQELRPNGLARLLQTAVLLWYAIAAGAVEWTVWKGAVRRTNRGRDQRETPWASTAPAQRAPGRSRSTARPCRRCRRGIFRTPACRW